MVRPEDVVLTRKGSPDSGGRLAGQVVSQMFLGSATRVEVALADDTRVVSVRDRRTDEIRVGDWVALEWRAGAARFFPEAP